MVVVPRIDPKSVVVKVAYKRIYIVFCYGPFWSDDDTTEFFFVCVQTDDEKIVIQKNDKKNEIKKQEKKTKQKRNEKRTGGGIDDVATMVGLVVVGW